MNETEFRHRLFNLAEDAPSGSSAPPALLRRARRRVVLTIASSVAIAVLVVGMGIAGVRAIQAAPTPADRPTPTPSGTVLRRDGEVITTEATSSPDGSHRGTRLVAVDPDTGESRIVVDVEQPGIGNAAWSPDGRWLAYDHYGRGLWVVNAERETRQLAVEASWVSWTWSPTAPQLAMVRDSRLTVVDASTGRQTDLGDVVGDVTSAPVWSPDGTRILYGARGGSLYSVDVGGGDHSLLVRLPGENLDSMDEIEWSPDGAYIAIVNDLEPGDRRLYVMNADGSRVRVLLDNFEPGGFAWSPDGTGLTYGGFSGRKLRIWTVSLDGSAPSLVASHTNDICCRSSPVWSPDGSQIAFRTARSSFVMINSDGTGDVRTIDELTYRSWDGGSYSCECT
jgi:Tol biopolymer transport system component